MSKLTQQVLVRMDPELHKAIKTAALMEERTMAQFVRFACRRYLNELR